MGYVLDLLPLKGIKSSGFRPCPQELSLYVIAYVAGAKGEKSRMARARGEKRRREPSPLFLHVPLLRYIKIKQ